MLAPLAALAAAALWESRVPAGLELPPVDLERRIEPTTIARAERYETFLRVHFFLAQAALVAVLAVYAVRAAGVVRASTRGRIGAGTLIGAGGLALAWLSQVPFRLVAVWWDRRYDQTRSGYLEALSSNPLELAAEFAFVLCALAAVMALAARWPRSWWLAAAPLFVALGAAYAFADPLFADRQPLDRPSLQETAREYARQQGIAPVELVQEDVTNFTSTPNAAALGFGPTATIVIWNTLLEGPFTGREVRVVLGHELAHHSRGHVPKGLAWYALFALPVAWLIAVATRARGGIAYPAAVPIALLALVVIQLASLPLANAISRHLEREADWVALETTRDPEAAAGVFVHFTTESLSDPDPPRWAYFLFESHPTVRERLAMAEAWRRSR